MAEWLAEHWAEIGVALLGLHTLAKAIAAATETKKDDEWVAAIGAFLAYLFVGKRPS